MYLLKCYHNSVYAYDNIGSYIFKRVMGTVAMNILRHLIGFANANVQDFIVLLLTSLNESDINTLENYSSHSQNSCDLYFFLSVKVTYCFAVTLRNS